MKVTPFEVYTTYLGMKNHFTKDKYDFVKYSGKTRASVASFNKRRDRYFFERMSRKKDDHEIVNYFIANFTSHDDPGKVWIGEIIENGETNFKDWQRRNQSLSYIFGNEVESIFTRDNFDSYFHTQDPTPENFEVIFEERN